VTAGSIDDHPLRNDPASAGAHRTLAVGDRTLLAISDGFIRIPPDFIGTRDHPTAAYDALHADMDEVRLPIGCFYLPGERNTLIDAGYGPYDYDDRGLMVGGRLLEGLRQEDVAPDDVDVLVLSHLHSDHTGWLADEHGEPTFAKARVQVGRSDWEHFVTEGSDPAPEPHVLAGLLALAERGQVDLIDGEVDVVPGLRRIPAPGHTPGHSIYAVHDRRDRVLLLGDAIYCPQQLTELDWAAAQDVDPVTAAITRQRLVRDLEEGGGQAIGCHFPGLLGGRLLTGDEHH
jgi:glyoxylase-like metal-dependent hydrolase (beta-lactamase superfamily II)